MTAIGEAVVAELVSQVVFKSVQLGATIVSKWDSFTLGSKGHEYQLRFNTQIARLDEVQKLLTNPLVARNISARDRHTYYLVIRKLHELLLEYIQRTSSRKDANRVTTDYSAERLYKAIEQADPGVSDPSGPEARSWLTVIERVTWVPQKKHKLEKLVAEVEQWCDCLAQLVSNTIPSIFVRMQLTPSQIAQNTPGDQLRETNIKSQILIVKHLDETSIGNKPGSPIDGVPIMLDYSQLKFLHSTLQSAAVRKDGTESDEGRNDLGGASRRQWAEQFDERGAVIGRVIVEFKDRPLSLVTSKDQIRDVKRELRSLVRILRLATETESAFRVLYCQGFYEAPDHYGLVYRPPPSIDMDASMRCQSLGNILMNHDYSKCLAEDNQNRLDLAKCLAATMFHLHSVQWVHRSFNPDNILLFGRQSNPQAGIVDFNWSSPYVVGFDASRANQAASGRLPASVRWENRLYIHPDRQREEIPRFHKRYDIYSLGVVLLEIGILKCFKHPEYRKNTDWIDIPAADLQKKFVAIAQTLKSGLGRTYGEIVQVCLEGRFNVEGGDDAEDMRLVDAFRTDICERFDQIHY